MIEIWKLLIEVKILHQHLLNKIAFFFFFPKLTIFIFFKMNEKLNNLYISLVDEIKQSKEFFFKILIAK